MAHSFYFVIDQTPGNPQTQNNRVNQIQDAAKRNNLVCHQEKIRDVITLQIETQDDDLALVFKLSVETALCESHS